MVRIKIKVQDYILTDQTQQGTIIWKQRHAAAQKYRVKQGIKSEIKESIQIF